MNEIKRPLSLHLTTQLTAPRTNTVSSEPTVLASKRTALEGPRSIKPVKTKHNHHHLTKSHSTASTATTCSSLSSTSSSSSSSSSSSGYESPDSPSLILPYLYVGDQAQTQIDTISSLNIRYILSLQSLPKFLDTSPIESLRTPSISEKARIGNKTNSNQDNVDIASSTNSQGQTRHVITSKPYHQKPIIRQVNENEVEIETQSDNGQTKLSQHDVRHRDSDCQAGSSSCTTTTNENIAKELLPSVNSSKDYLVKFKSCVNRLIKGKCINISDTFEQLVDRFFDETHSFIEEARRNKCNILVHCKAGISRSPTIAIAYLMKWKRLHLQEAYEFVKQCRPQISPNLNFMGQLMNYERQLLRKGNTSRPCSSMLPSPTAFFLPGPSYQPQGHQYHHQSLVNSLENQASSSNSSINNRQDGATTQDDLSASREDNSREEHKKQTKKYLPTYVAA